MLKNNLKFFSFYFLFFIFYFISFAQGSFRYDSKGKRNPFVPIVSAEGKLLKLDTEENKTEALSLEGIIYDKGGISYAIVNGSVVKTGDTIGDNQVLKVEKDKVVFIKNGEIFEIELQKGAE